MVNERNELRARIVSADKRHVWHPYTAMDDYIANVDPLVIESAEGSQLRDVDGKTYIDGNSSWWVAVLGHNHPRLLARLQKQAEAMCHVSLGGIAHEQAALLAEELVAVAPKDLTRVFYSDDGTTAVEVALKLALQYWAQNGRPRRKRFVALDYAFHGESLGAVSVGGVEIIRRHFAGVLFDCLRVPPGRKGFESAFEALAKLLDEHDDEVAGVIVEPLVQGFAGMRIYDASYLQLLRERTTACDTFLICDEVFTGYGRTGPMWACDHAGVAPDILCIAKGFTAGILPMAATLATERIFAGFGGGKERAFLHGHTYAGHPLGAAIAREVLAIYREEGVIERATSKASKIAACFADLAKLPGVSESRSLGMIGALELGARDGYLSPLGWKVYEEALKRGAYLRPLGNVVYTVPPLNISDEDLDRLLSIISDSVEAVL